MRNLKETQHMLKWQRTKEMARKPAVCIADCRKPKMDSWLVYLMEQEGISVVWRTEERDYPCPADAALNSAAADRFNSLLGEPCKYLLGWVSSVECAGISALIGSRTGLSGMFLTEIGDERIYMASFSKGNTHSELIRPSDMALPSFGMLFTQDDADSAACISYGALLLKTVGTVRNVLEGADRARHVLYDIGNPFKNLYSGNRS